MSVLPASSNIIIRYVLMDLEESTLLSVPTSSRPTCRSAWQQSSIAEVAPHPNGTTPSGPCSTCPQHPGAAANCTGTPAPGSTHLHGRHVVLLQQPLAGGEGHGHRILAVAAERQALLAQPHRVLAAGHTVVLLQVLVPHLGPGGWKDGCLWGED